MKKLKTVFLVVGILAAMAGLGLWWGARALKPDVEPGDSFPAIELQNLKGEPVDVLAAYSGRVVLLDFWRST